MMDYCFIANAKYQVSITLAGSRVSCALLASSRWARRKFTKESRGWEVTPDKRCIITDES